MEGPLPDAFVFGLIETAEMHELETVRKEIKKCEESLEGGDNEMELMKKIIKIKKDYSDNRIMVAGDILINGSNRLSVGNLFNGIRSYFNPMDSKKYPSLAAAYADVNRYVIYCLLL